jgi:hypothetical protein
MIQTIPKLFNVEVDQSEQNRAQAWRPPQLAKQIFLVVLSDQRWFDGFTRPE